MPQITFVRLSQNETDKYHPAKITSLLHAISLVLLDGFDKVLSMGFRSKRLQTKGAGNQMGMLYKGLVDLIIMLLPPRAWWPCGEEFSPTMKKKATLPIPIMIRGFGIST